MNTSGGYEPSDGFTHESDSAVAERDPLLGKVIGAKYEILSFLGKGGMSVVYKAKQHPINRIVALKMLLAHLSKNEGSVRRFLQEATAAGQLTHPNVVSVFDFGLTEDGQPYLVMDFVKGESLAQLISARGPLPYKEALPLFIQICEGLNVAHESGVIHRDIKPSNLVVEERADGKHARIVDFGIAKMLDAESQQLTKTGEIFGSPFYMSPEQCEGRPLDNRSDIYSLGIVFYEVLSGVAPLAGQSSLETMRLHMEQMPESLQKSAPAMQVPLALENIIFKMIAKQKEKRYLTALAVKADLENLLGGEANALSGNLEFVSREISRKSKTLTTWAATGGVIALLAVVTVLAYPHVCAAYAEEQYKKAQSDLLQNRVGSAEECLRTSIDLSHSIHDVKKESRGLDSIIALYRKVGKKTELANARKRKQELIKEELGSLGLTGGYIDNYVNSIEHPLPVAMAQVKAGLPELRASKKEAAASKQEEQENLRVDEDDQLLAMASRPTPTPSPTPQSAISGPQPTPLARLNSSQKPTEQTSPAPAPRQSRRAQSLTVSDSDSYTNSPDPPPPDPAPSNGPRSTLSKTSKAALGLAKSRAATNHQAISILDDAPEIKDFREHMPDAQSPAGAGSSFGMPTLSGSTNGTISASANIGSRVSKAMVSMVASPDVLERLEVMLDYSLEQEIPGSFGRAISCATAAINMYGALKYNPDEELAQLYAKRAYAQFKTHHLKLAKNDVILALSIVGNDAQSQAGADAEAVLAMIYAKNGKQRFAIQQYQHAQSRLSDPNSSFIVRQGISGLH